VGRFTQIPAYYCLCGFTISDAKEVE